MLKHLLIGGAGGGSKVADFGLMLFRGFIGLFLALGHGRFKLPGPALDGFAGYLGKLGVPAPTLAAWSALFAELVCALLLALGLFTRPAAALIAVTMLVAVLTAHRPDPVFMSKAATTTAERVEPSGRTVVVETKGGTKEPALLYLMPAVLFLFTGAGRYGLDAVLRGSSPRGGVASPLEEPSVTRLPTG